MLSRLRETSERPFFHILRCDLVSRQPEQARIPTTQHASLHLDEIGIVELKGAVEVHLAIHV
ncbi:hypothetical protein [Olsenella sp. oral taxon 807]|uniref:hypothetical protein n=1 Tax=Olsenella sp. oral taxon 807 TaxID=712411 RepID=UPI001C0F9205|nr:hypothetical protein [Olsenella sp. oral taxon 807]